MASVLVTRLLRVGCFVRTSRCSRTTNATTAQGVGGTTDNDGRGFLLTNMFLF